MTFLHSTTRGQVQFTTALIIFGFWTKLALQSVQHTAPSVLRPKTPSGRATEEGSLSQDRSWALKTCGGYFFF